jgi:hypothetical protein
VRGGCCIDVFIVNPDLIVFAKSVRIRDWVPEPGD